MLSEIFSSRGEEEARGRQCKAKKMQSGKQNFHPATSKNHAMRDRQNNHDKVLFILPLVCASLVQQFGGR
jgi:hypothetical protein